MSSSKALLQDEASVQREADLKRLLRRNLDRDLIIGQVVKGDILERLWDELSRREFRDKFEAASVVGPADAGKSRRLRGRHAALPRGLRIHRQAVRTQQEPDRRRRKGRECGRPESLQPKPPIDSWARYHVKSKREEGSPLKVSKLDSTDGNSLLRSRLRSERKHERESSKASTMSREKSNKLLPVAQEKDTRLVRELVYLEEKEITVPGYVNEVRSARTGDRRDEDCGADEGADEKEADQRPGKHQERQSADAESLHSLGARQDDQRQARLRDRLRGQADQSQPSAARTDLRRRPGASRVQDRRAISHLRSIEAPAEAALPENQHRRSAAALRCAEAAGEKEREDSFLLGRV